MNFSDARTNFKRPFAQWNGRDEEHSEGMACERIYQEFLPEFDPKFTIANDAHVYTIGSCFAWEIQRALNERGFNVPDFYEDQRFSSVEGVKDGAFFTRFNIGSMHNEIRNLVDENFLGEKLLYGDDDKVLDVHFGTGRVQGLGTRGEKLEARSYFRGKARDHLNKCDLFIITLGLSEAFFDIEQGLYLNSAPPARFALQNPERFEARLIDYTESLKMLSEIRDMLKEIQPNIKMMVTVSPVALGNTFSGQDVVVANSQSKAILRAVAGTFTAEHDDAFYFPSYEAVQYSDPEFAYRWDKRHVKKDMVSKIIDLFSRKVIVA